MVHNNTATRVRRETSNKRTPISKRTTHLRQARAFIRASHWASSSSPETQFAVSAGASFTPPVSIVASFRPRRLTRSLVVGAGSEFLWSFTDPWFLFFFFFLCIFFVSCFLALWELFCMYVFFLSFHWSREIFTKIQVRVYKDGTKRGCSKRGVLECFVNPFSFHLCFIV